MVDQDKDGRTTKVKVKEVRQFVGFVKHYQTHIFHISHYFISVKKANFGTQLSLP